MRLWSLHPAYLDSKGLVALWREALLAKHVLENKTTGYRNHPQLSRFKKTKHPVNAIRNYLNAVYKEAVTRGYNFDRTKIGRVSGKLSISVTNGQIDYEKRHLLKKLKIRDTKRYLLLRSGQRFDPHPLFKIVTGRVEDWEIIK